MGHSMKSSKTNKLYTISIFVISLLFISCQQSLQTNNSAEINEEPEVQIVIQEVDTRPPFLQNLDPVNNSVFNHTTENATISGFLSDASEIKFVELNSKKIKFSLVAQQNSLNTYGFSTSVDLVVGDNTFQLYFEDQDGNTAYENFIYKRKEPEFTKELIVKTELKELSLAGTTFVQVFSLDGEKETLLKGEDITLKAQQGYFSGFEYHAPPYGGMDVITATYKEQKAKGKSYIVIHSPKLKQNINGPSNIQIGKLGTFKVKIENPGDRDAVDSRIIVKLPDFFKVKDINDGKHITAINEIHWKLGDLSSGASREIEFSVEAVAAQRGKIIISAMSSKEEIVKQAHFIKVTGEVAVDHFCRPSIAEIEKEIITHVKIVANEDIENLKLNYDFADECVFVSAEVIAKTEIPVGFANTGKTIQFSTIQSLNKGETAIYKITFLVKRYGQMNNIARISLLSNHDEKVVTAHDLTIPTLD